jgi:tRNA G18 (ribose-2'-O)-methylase SpoU
VPVGTAVIDIDDLADPRIADFRDLKDVNLRKVLEPRYGMFIAESALVIEQVLAADYRLRSFLVARNRVAEVQHLIARAAPDVPVFTADYELLEHITGFNVHRGVLAAVERKPPLDAAKLIAQAHRLVVLESLVDHTNVGAIFRSATALGWDGILLDDQCADPLYRRSVRVSMGSVLRMPWARVGTWPDGLHRLTDAGFRLLALTPREDAADLSTLSFDEHQRVALLLGTEGGGLSPRVLQLVDEGVRIPMARGIDSLNVGAAAAIALWHLR